MEEQQNTSTLETRKNLFLILFLVLIFGIFLFSPNRNYDQNSDNKNTGTEQLKIVSDKPTNYFNPFQNTYEQLEPTSVNLIDYLPSQTSLEVKDQIEKEINSGNDELLSKIVIDCGTATTDNEESYTALNCINLRFQKCHPAIYSVSLDLEKSADTLGYQYEIIGYSNGLCSVKSEFTEHPDLNWLNKEMVCGYDNTVDFISATMDMNNCNGELYRLFTGAK
jgi:hypothetical protein